jgi:hypothetical protein
MEMKLWCFDDAHYWGTSLAEAAQKRGHEVALFDTVKEVGQEGILFYHMHHHPAVRDHHKRAMAQFATIPGLKLIPSYRTSVLYDDRIEQLRVAFARMIAMMHGIHFAGFDFIRNGSSWYLMKIIAGWSLRRYVNARFFPDGRTGAEFWEVMVDQMEQRNL